MIVCSCNVLSDQDVRTACQAETRPRSTGQVYGCLGCSAQCGRCARTIRKIMDEALERRLHGACNGCATTRSPENFGFFRQLRWMPPICAG